MKPLLIGKDPLTIEATPWIGANFGLCPMWSAVGDEIDIAVHCHNELDLPSPVGVAKAVEPIRPLFMEDPTNPAYSEAWVRCGSPPA